TMTVVDLVRLCGRERPRRIGRRRERFPGLDEIDRLAHAREQLRLGVIVLPAAGFVELNEMSTAPLGERTPLLRDLDRHAARYLLGHRQAPAWKFHRW